ncbi:MAG: hypothetical protein Q9198_005636 [Flavoplaca austrocitrina]
MAIDHSNTAKPANFLSSEAIDDFRARLAQQGPDRPDVDFTQFLQKTPRCSPSLPFPPETEKIQAQEASAAGDLTTVKRVTHDWKGNMQGFSDSLMAAIDNGHMAVASKDSLPVPAALPGSRLQHQRYRSLFYSRRFARPP